MSFYFVKTPNFIRSFYKNYIWNITTDKKEIFLTFDDGPTPKITSFVLDLLSKHNAKATFFCIGKNIKNHPNLFNRIIKEGHTVGNHTQNHENGWKTNNVNYLNSVDSCELLINKSNLLFRPPYGKIKRSQAIKLIKNGYKIIMWSVLSGDFDTKLSKEKCLDNVLLNTKKGDIIVLHDSKKAFNTLQYILPKIMQYYADKGYQFKCIK